MLKRRGIKHELLNAKPEERRPAKRKSSRRPDASARSQFRTNMAGRAPTSSSAATRKRSRGPA